MSEQISVKEWLERFRLGHPLHVSEVGLSQCQRWYLGNGVLKHETGGFFSVVGYRFLGGAPYLGGFEQPMIDQPEVGILGFVVRPGVDGWQWLLHAKTEPGNVGGTQVGPTVQATYSNYMQLHGGRATQMLELFVEPGTVVRCLTDVEQSEQGDRFLGKYNRNMVVEVQGGHRLPTAGQWHWFLPSAIKEALHQDFAINTDARSVLFCSDWIALLEAGESEPFARWRKQGGFGESLWNSWHLADGQMEAMQAQERLQDARSLMPHRSLLLGVDELCGWRMDERGLQAEDKQRDPVLRFYAIDAPGREVEQWCQPLMANRAVGRVVLLCAHVEGILRFWLNISFEPGLTEGAQWGPTFVSGAGHGVASGVLQSIEGDGIQLHARVMQSDEGGRFMNSVASYEVLEVSEKIAQRLDTSGKDGAWISLKQLSRLKGMLTNEMRSVASLLLKWC